MKFFKKNLFCIVCIFFSMFICGISVSAVENENVIIKDYINQTKNCLWIDGCSNSDSVEELVKWRYNNGSYYLYIPSSAGAEDMIVWHTFDEDVTVNDVKIASGEKTSVFSKEGTYTVKANGSSYNVVVMRSSNLAALFMKTDNHDVGYLDQSKDNYDSGNMLIADASGDIDYENTFSKIRGRGNATWGYAKKPYNLTLGEKASLLGMDASKKWTLLANYQDISLMRNKLIYDLSNEIGLKYSPDSRLVDLYLNGDYRGTYQLCEKVEVGKNNLVKITDLEKETEKFNDADLSSYGQGGWNNFSNGTNKYYNIPNNPEDITGGYLLELELINRYGSEASGFCSKHGQPVVCKGPGYASKTQIDYISSFYQDFEDALYSSNGYNSKGKYYTDYIDVESFVRMYFIQELSKNLDAAVTSFYICKDSDITGNGKLYASPAWDFDIALGNSKIGGRDVSSPSGLWVQKGHLLDSNYNISQNPTIYNLLFSHSDFYKAVSDDWNNYFYQKAKGITNSSIAKSGRLKSTDQYAEEFKTSAEMNNKRWGIMGKNLTGVTTGNSYDENVQYINNFVNTRLNFLNKTYSSGGEEQGGEEQEEQTKVKVYFDNSNSKWSEVYAYIWASDGSQVTTVVKFELVDKENSIYAADVSTAYPKMLFKNTDGTSNWDKQTNNLYVPSQSGQCYKPDSSSNKSSGNWYSYVEDTSLEISSITASKESPAKVSDNVTFTAKTKNASGECIYEFKINGETVSSEGNTLEWTPDKSGIYTINVTVQDSTGSTASSEINYEVKERNLLTVYYNNFENPNIYYKIGNSDWDTSNGESGYAMKESSDIDGYYEYTIDMGDVNTAVLCFNDGNGNWDNNNLNNYQFTCGKYIILK